MLKIRKLTFQVFFSSCSDSGVGFVVIFEAFWAVLGSTLAPLGRLCEDFGTTLRTLWGPRVRFGAILGTIGHLGRHCFFFWVCVSRVFANVHQFLSIVAFSGNV